MIGNSMRHVAMPLTTPEAIITGASVTMAEAEKTFFPLSFQECPNFAGIQKDL